MPINENRNFSEEIVSLVRGKYSPAILREKIEDYHENSIADALALMTVAELQRLYRIIDTEMLADVLSYVDDDVLTTYLKEMSTSFQAKIISELDSDRTVDFLKSLDKKERDTIISLMDRSKMKEVAMLATFDEDQIGSRMTTDFITVRKDLTVPEAMKALISEAADNDNITTIYAVNQDGTFYGAVSLKDLIIARKEDNFESLITTSYPFVYAKEEIDSCLEWIKDYSEDSIPALDDSNHIIGILTSQEVVDIVDTELGEDYAKLGGLSAEEDLEEPMKLSVRKRLPWLIVLLLLGMVVSSVVGIFEKVVAQVTVLMLFQSMVLDMAGNVGTQSLAVTIRVLMDDTVKTKQKLALVWKEGRIGLTNGVILGAASFALAGLYLHFAKTEPWNMAFTISACIAIALVIAMFVSSLVGTVIPMFFKKVGVDPAVASGPLITTLNDLTAVISYYGLAWILLINVMHY